MNARIPLWIIVVVVFLLGNTAAYALYTRSNTNAPGPTAETETPKPEEKQDNGLARALRIAGLDALEKENYPKAAEKFQAAIDAGGEGDLKDLLKIATDLTNENVGEKKPAEEAKTTETEVADAKDKEAPEAKDAKGDKPTEETKSAKGGDKEKAVAKKKAEDKGSEAKPADKAAPETPPKAIALFTTTPPGLRVVVDRKRKAQTPVRMELTVGTHEVEFYYGKKRLAPGTFKVKRWGATTVNRDLSAQIAELEGKKGGKPTIKAPEAKSEEKGGKGNLLIFSEVYGDVFVNGRRVGFPPVEAQQLDAGKARIEVRRQGKVERALTVKVVAGERTQIRIK